MLIGRRVPFKYVANKVKADVLGVMLFSVAFQLLKAAAREQLPEIPIQLPTVLGTSISLLLAFNLNQSYDRWWEARKVWGAIVNDSRTLVLQLQTFVRAGTPEVLKSFAYRQIAWSYALGQALRGLPPLAEPWQQLLSVEERAAASKHRNVPLAVLAGHHRAVRQLYEQGALNDIQLLAVDGTLVRLCDAQGRAERIKSTVFPVTYRMFIHLFIYLFLIVFSLSLVEALGVYEVPILVLVASTFFLVERTGLHMQDPFENRPTDTAMTAVARTIEVNLRQLVGDAEVPEPLAPEGFYLR